MGADGRALSEEQLRNSQGQAAAAVQLRLPSGAVTRCGTTASVVAGKLAIGTFRYGHARGALTLLPPQ